MNRSSEELLAANAAHSSSCEIPRGAADRLGFMLAALGGRLEEIAAPRLAEIGLDGHDYGVLAILTVDGPGTQHELAQLMNKAPGVIVAAVDQLEGKGFVERQRDPADRRRSRVTPTPAGTEALAAADAIGEQIVGEVLSGLDATEITGVRDLLIKGLQLEPVPQPSAAT